METSPLRRGLAERARSVRRGPVHNFSPAFNKEYLVFNHRTSHMQLAGVIIAVRFGLERTSYVEQCSWGKGGVLTRPQNTSLCTF